MNRSGRAGKLKLLGLMAIAALGLLALALPAAAAAKDRNHDRIPDRWEKRHNLSLRVNQAHRDQDRDKLANRKEFESGMDPNDADSDNDGVEDGDEGAGTIVSFDETTGQLTINDLVGGSATGLVTDDTEIKCDNGDDQGDEDGDGEGGHHGQGGGDDQGDDGGDDGGVAEKGSSVASNDDPAGDDQGEDEEGDDEEGQECSTADLTPNAMVQEADLELTGDGFVWDEIELLK
jgi:hypothetical protein